MSTTIEQRIHNTFKAELKRLWREYDGGKNPQGEAYFHTARTFKMPVQEIKKAIVTEKARTLGVSEESVLATQEAKRQQKQAAWLAHQEDMVARSAAARIIFEKQWAELDKEPV